MCFFFHVEVLKAFSDDDSHSFSYGLLELHCSELAEDLLDHALWRVFSAAGEDHRGVLGAAELEKALQAESGSSGRRCRRRAAAVERIRPEERHRDPLEPWTSHGFYGYLEWDSMAMDR